MSTYISSFFAFTTETQEETEDLVEERKKEGLNVDSAILAYAESYC